MARILAIDYGRKRCGVAVTDPLRITATGLPTVRTCDLEKFLQDYCARETVDEIVVGYPRTMRGEDSQSMQYIRPFLARLKKIMPDMKVTMVDERFTSTIAHREMLAAGFRRKDRQRKELADEMSAVLILNTYLDTLSRPLF